MNHLRELRQNIKTLKELHVYEAYHQSIIRLEVITGKINFIYGTNIKDTKFPT
jgi:hypothetical protein